MGIVGEFWRILENLLKYVNMVVDHYLIGKITKYNGAHVFCFQMNSILAKQNFIVTIWLGAISFNVRKYSIGDLRCPSVPSLKQQSHSIPRKIFLDLNLAALWHNWRSSVEVVNFMCTKGRNLCTTEESSSSLFFKNVIKCWMIFVLI